MGRPAWSLRTECLLVTLQPGERCSYWYAKKILQLLNCGESDFSRRLQQLEQLVERADDTALALDSDISTVAPEGYGLPRAAGLRSPPRDLTPARISI